MERELPALPVHVVSQHINPYLYQVTSGPTSRWILSRGLPPAKGKNAVYLLIKHGV